MSDEFDPVTLSDGTHVAVVVPPSDDGVIAVRLRRGDHVVAEARVPYPMAGLAGGRLILSSRERFVVLSMYSGQSEEGYELFQIGDGIARVSGLPYVFGEGAGFCFSADESILVMALAFSSMEWWLPWEEEAAEPDDDGRLVFAFGELRMHDIATSAISVHEMRVSVGRDWEPARREYDPNLEPRFIDQRRLALSMPWGDIELDVPPRGQITLVVE